MCVMLILLCYSCKLRRLQSKIKVGFCSCLCKAITLNISSKLTLPPWGAGHIIRVCKDFSAQFQKPTTFSTRIFYQYFANYSHFCDTVLHQ